jgi:hypothetical protein
MQKSITTTEQFCLGLLELPLCRTKAIANFILGLLSECSAQHPVDAFLSPFCQYTHSNLGKIVEDMSADEAGWELAAAAIRSFSIPFGPPLRQHQSLTYCSLTLDVTKICKPHSPSLEARHFVPKANEAITGNKAIDIGYRLSMLHWEGEPGWPLPWRSSMPGLGDLSGTLNGCLCVVNADCSYGQAAFLAPLYPPENVVCIARFRTGMRVWLPSADDAPTGGARRIYGEKYYLRDSTVLKVFNQKPSKRHPQGLCSSVEQRSITELGLSEEVVLCTVLKNGRKVIYRIKRWCDVMIRSKNGHNMKDKPFDILRIEVRDETSGQLVFERPLFVAVSGQRRSECSNQFIQQSYRERYDVEPFYNFLKHKLLLQHFQTPERQHLLNYLLLAQVATWVLWCAHGECSLVCRPWQKYLPKNKEAVEQSLPRNIGDTPKLSIAQTRQSIKTVFSTFDLTAFKPGNYKKGKGRVKGSKLEPRTRHPVLRKAKKEKKYVKRE